jgi:membrane associated rhomboid family serine protease
MSILDDIKREWTSGNRVSQLIIINVGVWLCLNLLQVGLFAFANDINHSLFNTLLQHIEVGAALRHTLTHPWTVITYQFMHLGFMHLLFNMLWFYMFGRILQDLVGVRVVLPIYILGGVAGFVVFALGAWLLPPQFSQYFGSYMLGASAGVMAIMLAAVTLAPDYEVQLILIGRVRIKYIGAIMVLLDLISIQGMSNTGGHFAHLGGALMGWLMVNRMRNGSDWSNIFNRYWYKITNFVGRIFGQPQKPTFRAVPKKQPASVFNTPHQATDGETADQRLVDAILEKIKRSGIQSLTDKERDLLYKVSKDKK